MVKIAHLTQIQPNIPPFGQDLSESVEPCGPLSHLCETDLVDWACSGTTLRSFSRCVALCSAALASHHGHTNSGMQDFWILEGPGGGNRFPGPQPGPPAGPQHSFLTQRGGGPLEGPCGCQEHDFKHNPLLMMSDTCVFFVLSSVLFCFL